MRKLTGGARPFIRDLVPGVVSPETIDENIDFFLVAGHGATNTQRLMIIPDNTFLLFVGESGFIRDVRANSEKMAKLVSPRGYINPTIPLTEDIKKGLTAERNKDLYESFIVGGSRAFHFYGRSMIYCPGDVLPDTRISFQSEKQFVAWYKGVYQLPVSETTDLWNFTGRLNSSYKLSSLVKEGIADEVYIGRLLKPEKREEFFKMADTPYVEWIMSGKNYESDLSEFFDDVDEAGRILNQVLYDDPVGNLAKKAGFLRDGNYLSELLSHFPSKKGARFFIFTGCRGPMFPGGETNATFGLELAGAEPFNFPPELTAAPLRKLQRRFSLSSKCVSAKGAPAMNLEAVRAAYKALIFSPRMDEYVKHPHNAEAVSFIRFLHMCIFVGHELSYASFTPITNLGLLLAYAYTDIPEETSRDMPLYEKMCEIIRDSFSEFTRLLRREVDFDTTGLTMEQVLLRFSGFDYTQATPFVRNNAAARSVRGERRIHEAVNRAEREAFEKEAGERLNSIRIAMDILEKAAADGIQSIKDDLKSTNEFNVKEFTENIDKLYTHLLNQCREIRDIFTGAREQIFFRFRGLREADRSAMVKAYAEMEKRFDEFPKRIAPYKELLEEVKARRNVSGVGRSRRGRTTRRLRRKREH